MTDDEIRSLGTILGVWAHPDDEAFTSAGLMHRAVRNGQRVVCVTATRGEKGSVDHKKWPPAKMGEIRTRELAESLAIIGVREHQFLGYTDGECKDIDDAEATARIAAIMREVDPDSVLTFGPDGMTNHSDHKCVSRWATTAYKHVAKSGARLLYATQTQEWVDKYYKESQRRNIFEAPPPVTPLAELAINFHLTPELLKMKFQALKAQRSQIEILEETFGDELFRGFIASEYFALAEVKS